MKNFKSKKDTVVELLRMAIVCGQVEDNLEQLGFSSKFLDNLSSALPEIALDIVGYPLSHIRYDHEPYSREELTGLMPMQGDIVDADKKSRDLAEFYFQRLEELKKQQPDLFQ